jgi:hypothetical protein
LKRADWRRENINAFIQRTSGHQIREAVGQVRISPFGIWQPGHPPQIKG